jgi:Tol biopolymer transport system component
MIRITLTLALAVLIAGLTSCGETKKEEKKMEKAKRIPVEEFFKNPEKSSYQISPNGNYVSYMAPWQDRMNIFIKEMDKDSATRITSVTDRDIAGYFWANDNRLVYLRDDGGNEDYYLLAVDRDGSNELALTKMEGVKTQIIDDLENIPDEMIIGLNKRIPQILDPDRKYKN